MVTTINSMSGEHSTRPMKRSIPSLPQSKTEGKMNAEGCQKILEENLHLSDQKWHMGHTFQKDNGLKQGKVNPSVAVAEKVKVLRWSPQSPKLNVIEPLWGDCKCLIHVRQLKNLRNGGFLLSRIYLRE